MESGENYWYWKISVIEKYVNMWVMLFSRHSLIIIKCESTNFLKIGKWFTPTIKDRKKLF